MPTVPKTSPEQITKAARKLIARVGAENLSMQGLAAAVGVRAPSLYKHFPDRASILGAVTREVALELEKTLAEAASTGAPRKDLAAIAHAYRHYAHRFPRLYGLMFTAEAGLTKGESRRFGHALFVVLNQWIPSSKHLLEAARALVAFTHGFVMMEQSGAFQLGGDVERAFDFGLERLIEALAAPG